MTDLKKFALAATMSLVFVATTASAQSTDPFDEETKVTDMVLANSNGKSGESLTRRNVATLTDNYTSPVLQLVAGNARVQMDVWWGTTGSELIASSVRANAF